MKTFLVIITLCFSTTAYCQDEYKNSVGFQFGGQAIVGFSYDRTIINKNNFSINGVTGIVINEHADDQDQTDRPIYGINLGVSALYDLKFISIEGSIYSSPYFYKSLTFINYYSWLGLRINSKEEVGVFFSIGWTPSLYFSKDPPDHFNHVPIGVKAGAKF